MAKVTGIARREKLRGEIETIDSVYVAVSYTHLTLPTKA